MQRLKSLWNDVAGEGVDYSQFESRQGENGISVFRENSPKYTLFGTNIHVTFGALAAATVGLIVTIIYCIIYAFYHTRGQGRNPFIDHIELVELLFAVCLGLPCHYLLFYGIYKENKRFLTPFLIFYCTNFVLNLIFASLAVTAAILDIHRVLMGKVKYDFGWVIFQILFTAAEGFAIYLVLRCRKFFANKEHWKKLCSQDAERDHSIIADGVSIGQTEIN